MHRLVVEDAAQLERRKEEINDAIVNSTCNFADGWYSEVGQVPLLLLPSLLHHCGLLATAKALERRSCC